MINVLYGNYRQNLKFKKVTDFLVVPLKTIYIIYSIPFLLFALFLSFGSLGAFGNPLKEKVGPIKKVLLHMSLIFLSFIFWGISYNFFIGKYN